MSSLFSKLYEGGPFFMFPALVILILIIILSVKSFINLKKDNSKAISLIASLGLFALIWGILGQAIGLMQAFDAIQQMGKVSPSMLAGGLKVSMITTTFGFIIFLIARIAIIIFTWLQKDTSIKP